MADSENSRTLPAITPRNLLPATERFLQKTAVAGVVGEDPALIKWGAWLTAHRECDGHCSLQQRLEAKMLRTVRSPQVEISIPDRTSPIAVTTEEIDAWLAGEEFAERRAHAKEQLEVRRREWDAVDSVIGYSPAKQAKDMAAALECRLAQELRSPSFTP